MVVPHNRHRIGADGAYREAPGFILMCQATTGVWTRHKPKQCGAGNSSEIPPKFQAALTTKANQKKKRVVKDDGTSNRVKI